MPEFAIIDDILAPKGKEVLEFKVPNPFSAYSKMPVFLQNIFKGRGKDTFEDDFKWDTTKDPIDFFVKTRFERKVDNYTDIIIEVRMYGRQPMDPSKIGSVMFELGGSLETKYPAGTPFQKIFLLPFLLIYHYLIYNRVRRGHIEFFREGIEKLSFAIRQSYEVPLREALRR